MVSVYLDDKVIFDRPLVTLQQVEEAGFFGRNWDSLVIWVNGLFEDDEQ
jgi:D-alanyl-D-alanine carboxypeptidase (penicillin-binding protein 5/6)